jgi:hypothetical protein
MLLARLFASLVSRTHVSPFKASTISIHDGAVNCRVQVQKSDVSGAPLLVSSGRAYDLVWKPVDGNPVKVERGRR